MTDIATIRKNGREEIRVSLDHFKGHDLVNLRVFYRDAEGEMRPGKQGLAFRVELLRDVLDALRSAEAQALSEREDAE